MDRRRLALVALAIGLVACGGAAAPGDTASAAANDVPTTAATEVTTAATGATDGGGSESGHRAKVTIGDLSWNLHSGGIFWVCAHSATLIAGNYAVDPGGNPIQPGNPDIGVQINYVLLAPDSTDPQTPMITVQDTAAGTQWQTGEVADVPEAAIGDISLVDGVATGAAVFFDLASYLAGNPPELVEGTFEIVCES